VWGDRKIPEIDLKAGSLDLILFPLIDRGSISHSEVDLLNYNIVRDIYVKSSDICEFEMYLQIYLLQKKVNVLQHATDVFSETSLSLSAAVNSMFDKFDWSSVWGVGAHPSFLQLIVILCTGLSFLFLLKKILNLELQSGSDHIFTNQKIFESNSILIRDLEQRLNETGVSLNSYIREFNS
jgi:hypothetical protein